MASDKPRIKVPANSYRSDGLENLVSRQGTGADKAMHDRFTHSWQLFPEIDAAYRTSTWLRKIVDAPADDAVSEWRDWLGIDKTKIATVEAEEKRLGVRQNVRDAMKMARKDGGSVIFMDLPGSVLTEADVSRVSLGGLRFISALSRHQVTCGERISNPLNPYYGQPSYYQINQLEGQPQIKVHPSRVVRIMGNERFDYLQNWDGFGDSVFVSLERALKNAESTANATNSLVNEAKLDIISIPDLMMSLATSEFEATLHKRFQLANTLKGIHNMLLLDTAETYEQKTQTFQGLPAVLENFLMILSGASDIPATRLLGRSPAGMNATGESDMQNYHKKIRGMQELDIGPALNKLDESMIRSALGSRPADIWYQWAPLGAPTEAEQIAMQKTRAETQAMRISSGMNADVINEIEANAMNESGLYPGLDELLEKLAQESAEPEPQDPSIPEDLPDNTTGA